MKSLKKKVILSAFVLGFSLLTAFGSTYAWFTVSNTVTINSIELNVSTSPSLLIRVYDEDAYYFVGAIGASNIMNIDGTTAYSYISLPSPHYVEYTPSYTISGVNLVLGADIIVTDVENSTEYHYAGDAGISDILNNANEVIFDYVTDHFENVTSETSYTLEDMDLTAGFDYRLVNEIDVEIINEEDLYDTLPLAKTGAGLYDATTYKNYLESADFLSTSLYANLNTWRLQPVTAVNSAYTDANGFALKRFWSPNHDSTRILDPIIAITDINDTSGRVIELKLWVFSQGTTNYELYLSDLDVVAGVNSLFVQDNSVNATRISVTSGSTSLIYGNSVDYDFDYLQGSVGYADYTIDYTDIAIDEATADSDNTLYYWFGATGLSDIMLTSDDTIVYAYHDDATDYFTDVTLARFTYLANRGLITEGQFNRIEDISATFAPTVNTLNGNSEIISSFAGNTPTLITIRVYIEGWDVDANNNIIAANMTISLALSIGPID
ncbi:MAG: hypothetical protein WC888_00125 [Candidatus Izemoplasmatales bacterium]|jgi:hypothetical protein